jgi:SOS-response transcriptional repressor LexA
MREAGPLSAAQEEAFIRAAAEEGLRMRDTALKPRDETFYQLGSAPFDYAQDVMKPYYEETIPGYEGRENIYKNMATYEDVVGFEPGQIDRQLLDAAQAKQSDLEKLVFGQGPGSAVRMDGSGFDPSTAAQKSIEGAGSTAPLLGLSLMGPLGTAAAIAGGQQSVAGELSQETDSALQGLYDTGRLQNSDRFKQLVAANEGDEAAALKRMQQDARDLSQMPSAVLGGGATAVEAALLRMGLPGAAAIPIVEGLQEGPGESIAANQILQTVTGFGLPVNRRETLESGTAGIGGGATVSVPVSGAQAFVPSGPRAGQPAASTVPTEYSDSLIDTGMSGVGDVASDASSMEVMAAEKIIEDQVASTGTVDPKVAENLKDRTGLSSEEINNMAEKAGGTGPFILTPEMRVQEGAFQLTPEIRVQEGAFQLTEDMRVEDAPNVPAAEAPIDLSGIPSRLTLTGAESLGPTTPDLSGIASNLTLGLPQTPAIPADPATPVLQKNGVATTYGDALANETVTATQQLENARITGEYTPVGATFEEQLANMDQDIKNLADQLVAENYTMPTDAVTSKMDADAAAPADTNYQNAVNLVNNEGKVSAAYVQRQLGINYDQAQDVVQRMEDEGLISAPNHVGKRTVNTEAVSAAATPEVTGRINPAIKAAAQAEETPVFTSVRETTETPVFTSVREGIPAAADAAITSKMDADAAATQAKTEDLAATQEEDVAAVIDLPEEFQEQLELPTRGRSDQNTRGRSDQNFRGRPD